MKTLSTLIIILFLTAIVLTSQESEWNKNLQISPQMTYDHLQSELIKKRVHKENIEDVMRQASAFKAMSGSDYHPLDDKVKLIQEERLNENQLLDEYANIINNYKVTVNFGRNKYGQDEVYNIRYNYYFDRFWPNTMARFKVTSYFNQKIAEHEKQTGVKASDSFVHGLITKYIKEEVPNAETDYVKETGQFVIFYDDPITRTSYGFIVNTPLKGLYVEDYFGSPKHVWEKLFGALVE